ncbi:peptide cleavage/export ABC transporter [Lactobacillus sp. AN1001]
MIKYYKYYTPQIDESDCGIAVLSMILKKYGSNISISRLRSMAKTNREGTTALGIIKTAQKLKFETKAIQADISLIDINDLPCPFIVHVIKDSKLLHYYVILDINKNSILIADPDPSVRITRISRKQFSSEWTGVAIFIVPTNKYRPIKENKSYFSFLFHNLIKYKKLLISIIIAATLMTGISIIGSYYLQIIIDILIPNSMKNALSIISMGLLIGYLFNSIFLYFKEFMLTILGQRLSVKIVLGYIKHVFNLPMEFFVTRKTGEILSRFNDADKIIDALASIVTSVFLDTGIILVTGIILFIQNSLLFSIILLALPIYIIIILSFSKSFEKLNIESMEKNSTVSSSIIEDIKGIETIKALNSENQRFNRITNQFIDLLKKNLEYSKKELLQRSLKNGLQSLLNLIILWFGAELVISYKISLGQLITYDSLLFYFTSSLQNIINLQPKLKSAKVANNRLNDILLIKNENRQQSKDILQKPHLNRELKFNNVSYKYGYEDFILNDITFSILPNEKITLIGLSGSGKSTLAKLLVNFFKPTSGEITLDGQDIQNFKKSTIRNFINYIPQTPYIFSGTILDNLKLGNSSNITLENIYKACEITMIKNDIEKMPLQYQTFIDEEGSTLSGGQKQRIIIARAILSPAKILIFDESTSGLDTITETKLINNLLKFTDKTIIFITHRLSIAKNTDKIFVLNNGFIVEQGSHDELLSKKGIYYKLVNA